MTHFRLVQEFLEKSAQKLPDKIALVCGERRLTYAEIDEKANRVANALKNMGVSRGDRVALFMQNSVELVIGIFAVLKADAVFVVINPTTKPDKLVYILNNCAVTCLFFSPQQKMDWGEIRQHCPSLKAFVLTHGESIHLSENKNVYLFDEILKTSPSNRPIPKNIDLDLACLIYTSGSTGEPKGVMSDHSNIIFAVDSITSYIGNTEDDIVIDVLPLSFDYGLYQLLMVFSFGGRLILEKGFNYPAQILTQIEKEKVTGFPGVPTIFSMLVNMDLSSYDLSSLRYMTNTAATLPPAHILKIRDTFPNVKLFSMYGLTETKRTLYLPPSQLDAKPDSVGIAIPGTEVWIEDENGNRLGAGEVGELVVRGRHVMRGYWGDPDKTARGFYRRVTAGGGEDLFYRTGDLVQLLPDGNYKYLGRKDRQIKTRGYRVELDEIEVALLSHEGVQEAAVYPMPDGQGSNLIEAAVTPKAGATFTEADLIGYIARRLPPYALPVHIAILTDFPRTSTGKIDRRALQAQATHATHATIAGA